MIVLVKSSVVVPKGPPNSLTTLKLPSVFCLTWKTMLMVFCPKALMLQTSSATGSALAALRIRCGNEAILKLRAKTKDPCFPGANEYGGERIVLRLASLSATKKMDGASALATEMVGL